MDMVGKGRSNRDGMWKNGRPFCHNRLKTAANSKINEKRVRIGLHSPARWGKMEIVYKYVRGDLCHEQTIYMF